MLLFCDGADHWSTLTQGLMKWTAQTSNAGGSRLIAGVGTGRFGTNAININGGTSGGELNKTGFGTPQTVILGFALTAPAGQGSPSWPSRTLACLRGGGATHLTLVTDSSGCVHVQRAGVTLGSPSAEPLTLGYHYFELKAKIDDTTGTVELRIDGATVVGPLTSQDTRNAGAAYVDTFAFNGLEAGGGVASRLYDDVYLCDTSGSYANDFLGDIQVQTILPNGNGNSSQLIGNDLNSVDNYLLMDEATPDDDTTYVESGTIGEKDTYAMSALTALTGTVHAVVSYGWAKKTAAGTRQVTTVARSGSTDEDGATATLGTGYGLFKDVRHTKPGGGAWSIADVNAAEFGVKVVA